MIRTLHRSLSVLVCILVVNFVSFSQETTDPKTTKEDPNPKEQPLDKPTEVKEAPKKQEPSDIKAPIPEAAVAGGTPAGQTPTSTQDGTFVNRFQDIPVNLFTGTPIIGFPIYTLSEPGGASVPLGLSYNASGMKGHDVSGWTGMNWQMSTPQISRIVRGIPDEGKYTLDNSFNKTARNGSFQYSLKANGNEENDSQPDLFFLNINGQSYKFNFDNFKKAHFYPEADIDVQVNWISDNPTNNVVVGRFNNWIVTMPDGTKYTFSGDNTESSFEMEAKEATDNSNHYGTSRFYTYADAETVISAWYCDKITTAFGHETNFDYRGTIYSFFRIADQSTTTTNCTFNGINKSINKVFVNSATLFKISNQTQVVEFNKGGWTQVTDGDSGESYWIINNTYPARQDIDTYSRYPTNSSNSRALHKITVYAKDDSTKVFEWKFKYDYNYGNDPTILFTIFSGYSYSTLGYTHQRRFKLRSIEEPNGNKYTFKYYDDGFGLPSRFTQGIDHWGYLNGALGSNNMIGEDAFRVCASNQFGNRTATEGWSQYGTLTAISHSTGGSTILEYENHIARNYTRILGGSRIKKIMFVDSISNLKTAKRYDYQQINGKSSGFLCLKPVYHFDSKTNFASAPNQYWYSGLYQQLLSESGRPAVGYSRVKETILSGDEIDSLGYTISEFLQPLDEINLVETVIDRSSCTTTPTFPPVTTCDTYYYLRPWKWFPYHENTVGVPSRVAVYGKANQLLSEKSSAYTEQQLQVSAPDNFQQNYRSFRYEGQNYSFERQFFQFFQTFRVTSDTTKTYNQNGTNPVVSISNYEYPVQAKHNQLIKTTIKDSYGSTLTNTMKYPLDFQFDMTLPSNVEAQGIQALQQKHILSAVIESISKTKQDINSNDVFITGANYQTFYKADSTGVKAGMPKSSFSLENLPRLSMTEANYDPNTSVFTRSSDYDLKATAIAYTSIGLPVQSSVRFGTTSKITYDANYPTLALSQISNFGLTSEQTTSMIYDKILYGVSKQTGVNGLSVSNEFYTDGKLKQQTDKDGNVLKHIQYVYRGQADDDPLLTTNVSYNRIITRIPRIATTSPLDLNHLDCVISVVYMDGTGRVVENVGYRVSPNQKDMVSGMVEYDKFNRPKKTWLSVESSQNTGALLDTAVVKTIARAFYQDQMPYSEVLEYEDSPLSRVFKSYGVGKVWRDSSKYVQMEYQTATGIKRLFVNNDDDYMAIGTYLGYQLSKIISTDERGSQVIEYKDKSGNVVQRDVQVDNTTNYLTTLFCFDAAGRLRYIFPPKAVIALGTSTGLNVESWAEFNENVYSTHYDGRGRVFESHKPGIGSSRVVYNRMNQPVLSQDDDELAKNNTWNFAQMDSYGRTVKTGQIQLEAGYTRELLQDIFDNFTVNKQFEQRLPIGSPGEVFGYDNNSFPNILRGFITEASLKNVSYFDDYDWRTNNPYSGQITDYDFKANPYNSTAYSTTNAKGLMTGGLRKIDNFGDFWFPRIGYFDDKNRPIQSIGYQDLYARNQSDNKYNFVGESLINRSIYRKSGDLDRTITKENTLDYAGRTEDYYYTLREGTVDKVPRLKMFSLFYDNIGRLKTKIVEPKDNVTGSLLSGDWSVGSTWTNGIVPNLTNAAVINQGHIITIPAGATVQAGSLYDGGMLKFLNNSRLILGSLAPVRSAGLQTIEYLYNVRSQIRGVNLDASENPQVSQNKLFSYKIDYHEDGRYFDGSISKQTWKAQNSPQNRSYLYSYDRSNRLTNSQYSGIGTENYSVSNSYDANGNILNLQRYSKTGTNTFGLVDNLTYSYLNNGNKLQKVDDSATIDGFKNGTNSGDDYDYYSDGKLKKDLNRNISKIEYNYLDLVSKVKFVNNDSIQYFYTSTGIKRQSKRVIGGITSYTLYDGEIIYTFTGNVTSLSDYKVSEIQNSEGRFVNNHLEYGYTDHLGNLRLSYKDSLGTAFAVQSNSYDAWGYEIKPLRYSLNGALPDRYTWQGKEDLELDGLDNWSDFGWRIEDRALGRWFTPDPEDQFVSMSPFAVCANNPVSHIDPDGRVLPAFLIGAIIGALTSTASQVIQNKGFNNFSFGSLGIGTLTGAIGGGIADALPGLLGQSAATSLGGNIATGALNGALSGSVTGGVGSALSGGNFWDGALGGAIGGAIGGGFGGLLEGNPLKNALKNGDRVAYSGPKPKMYKGGILLKGVTVKGTFETGYDFISGGIRDTWADAVRVGSTLGSSLANNFTMVYREGVHEGAPYDRANSPYRPYYVKDNEWSLNRDSDYMGGISNARETAMYNSSKNLIVDHLLLRDIPARKFFNEISGSRRLANWGLNFFKDEAAKDVTKGVLKR
jgi:RHS repeat-associated protein